MNNQRSKALYDLAQKLMPAGVNSPVRAFGSVGCDPFYVQRGKGAYLYDVEGKQYIDYVSSWGASILGHADDGLNEYLRRAIEDGTSFGACHPHEIELSLLIYEAFPSIERIRLVNSGTEATMTAIRLARGFTGKNGVIKFRGCYHGHVDSLLVKAGSGLATFGLPDSEGVPKDLAKHTYVAEFNHIDSVEKIVKKFDDIACIIIEPIMGNMGVVLPDKSFLEHLRDICSSRKILLIFDEVITGFRVTFGGVQSLHGIKPDLTCLGKIIGGGFPIGAVGGRKDIMEQLAPLGPVYQAGTLSGNPIATRAGIYVLQYLKRNSDVYDLLHERGEKLKSGMIGIARKYNILFIINSTTGMFTGFFSRHTAVDYATADASDRKIYAKYFRAMLNEGVFFAPSQFEAAFLTLAHDDDVIDRTLEACETVFARLKR